MFDMAKERESLAPPSNEPPYVLHPLARPVVAAGRFPRFHAVRSRRKQQARCHRSKWWSRPELSEIEASGKAQMPGLTDAVWQFAPLLPLVRPWQR